MPGPRRAVTSGADGFDGTRVHLDSNILILSARDDRGVREILEGFSRDGVELAVSAMAWAEFRCGPASDRAVAAWSAMLEGRIRAVDRSTADAAAVLFNLAGRRSRSLPDCLIAATAIRERAPLATRNRADFIPFVRHGLVLA